jgi:hypothetical protein
LCWLNVIWPNAASTPAPTQRRFNESRSLEPHQTEDIKRYVQASAMMIAAQTVPASGNLKTWFTRVGEQDENSRTIMCYGSILQKGCECEGHFMRSGRNSQRNIRNRCFTAHGLARYLTIKNDCKQTDETRSKAVPLPRFCSAGRRPAVCSARPLGHCH